MNQFKAVLNDYLAARVDLAQLDASLNDALLEDPTAGPTTAAEIDRLHAAGRLSLEACSLLRRSIAISASPATGTSGPQAGAERDDKSVNATVSAGENDRPVRRIEAGTLLNSRFVLENIVGRGGMGIVFKARDLRKVEADDRNPYVAIKILNDTFGRHPESLRALQRESRKSQNLAHPNIVTVYDFDRDDDRVYMTMEFLEGETLERITKREGFAGMPFDEAYPLIEGMGNALRHAHSKGVVHSDFKPGNCFLTRERAIKVFDFGIARAAIMPDGQLADATRFDAGDIGALTPAYASWEMLQGATPDPRDDIYALGCVTYELLTGRHPFDKHSAADARVGKLVPRRIKGLRPGQWKTIERALAFERDERCPDVETFLRGLGADARKRAVVASGIAATVLLVVGAALLIPEYLQQQRIASSVAALTSGQDEQVAAALTEFRGFDATMRAAVMQEAGERVLAYFVDKIRSAVDAARGRYDYPAAQRWLAEAETYFADSAILAGWANRLADGKRSLLAEINSRFDENLRAGRLLAGPGDSVTAVLDILSEADPEHALLNDARLAMAFTTGAAEALDAQDFARAERLLEAGLIRFQNEPQTVAVMIEVQHRLADARLSQSVAGRVTELRARMSGFAEMQTLSELLSLGPEVAALDSLAPRDVLVTGYRERIAAVVDIELAQLLAGHRLDEAESLIGEVSSLLTGDQVRERNQRLAETRSSFEGEQSEILAVLEEAANDGRLDAALDALEQLEELGTGEATVAMARATIEQGYVRAALDARVSGDLERAAEIVARGVEFAPESVDLKSVASGIVEQRAFLESGDEAAAAARRTQIRFYRGQIPQRLAPSELDVEAARQVLDDVRRLANMEPGDPLVRDSRGAVAEKLANRTMALADEARWDEAVALSNAAVALVGESRRLRTLDAEVAAGREHYHEEQRLARIAVQRTRLQGLLVSPSLEDAWNTELNTVLEDLVDDDYAMVAQARRNVAERYVAAATDLRQQQSFAEADRMLRLAAGHAPGFDAIAAERAALDDAERAFQTEADAQGRAVRLADLRQRVLTAANARDLTAATFALVELTRAPANGPSAASTALALEAIGPAYLRIAEQSYDRGDFDAAETTARRGLAALGQIGLGGSPSAAAIRELAAEIPPARLAFNLRALEAILSSERPADVERAKALLAAVERDAGEEAFAEHVAALIAIVEQRIGSAPNPDEIRVWAAAIFGRELKAPLDNSGFKCTAELAGKGSSTMGGGAGQCWDVVDAGDRIRGPVMVVIPGGGFIPAPFAIGKHELSVGEWNVYCRLSGECPERDGNESLPVATIEFSEARRYAAWLSARTAAVYRLPTGAEWEYAASAPRSQHDDNCAIRGVGASPRDVAEGRANDWGLKNYIGNVSEWVTSGLGPELRGGSYRDDSSSCTLEFGQRHDGVGNDATGIRLVREL